MMDDMAYTLTTRDGQWNDKLYSSLYHEDEKGRKYFSTGDNAEDPVVHEVNFMAGDFEHPESLLVIKSDPVYVPTTKTGMQKVSALTWEPMGRSLARMTRNPIWFANYVASRRQMVGTEARLKAIFGDELGARMVTDTAAERAYNLTMAYADNPATRTNLAWQVRNIARYYRAQEDFARRMIRMAKYEPMGYWKAVLAWQASQDVGFIHKDRYGDEYFIYPLTAPAIGVLQNVSNFMGLTDAKYGIAPMAFSGKVQWLSPSMDPGQWLPTLSSPWTSVSLAPLMRSMPFAQDFFKEVERAAFGDIAAESYRETPFDGVAGNYVSGIYAALPPNFKKLLAIAPAFFGGSEATPGSFGYRITMKTMMGIAAAGNMPTGREWADPDVRESFIRDMQRRSIEMSVLSLIFGVFAPASPQYSDDYESIAARKAGYDMLNPAFQDMIQASVKNGKTWDQAYISWMASHPQDGIFVVSQSTSKGGAYTASTQRNLDFLKSNKDVWEEAPRGISLFMPDGKSTGVDDLKVFQAMQFFGNRQFKSLEDIGTELANVRGAYEWRLANAQAEADRAVTPQFDSEGETTPEWKLIDDTLTLTKQELKATYPGLSFSMYGAGRKTTDEWRADAEQIATAASALSKRGNTQAVQALDLVQTYREFENDYRYLMRNIASNPDPDQAKSDMKQTWEYIIQSWRADYPNYPKDQGDVLVTTLTLALNDAWYDITEGDA
jgi:alkylhydroperoxidase/carboxymuconolactone decarboxylase family protein YurZ